mmetsp:Transcript_94900/g.284400  ORF Transcript_94900/g.284400 Transcript_94900/m.284400 type:complete len:273 (+) Transcript_94900:420-1238(+)
MLQHPRPSHGLRGDRSLLELLGRRPAATHLALALCALGALGRLGVGLALGVLDRHRPKEALEPVLVALALALLQPLDGLVDALLGKLLLIDEVLAQPVHVAVRPLDVGVGGLLDHLWLLEELARLLKGEGLGQRVLGRVNLLERLLDATVVLDELERLDRTDALDRIGVVAAAQDAQVDELLLVELEALERRLQVDLDDRHLARLRHRQVAHEDRRAEREGVGVLGARREDDAALGERGARRLRLARRVDDGHAHQLEEGLDLLRLLPGGAH